MKVILTERVKTLGNVGEVVNVSAGHARNYLIPNNLAVLADEGNKKQLNHQQKALAKKVSEQQNQAQELKKKIDGLVLEMTKRVAASGKLFGTVTSTDLSKELEKRGFDVERRLLTLDKPIKSVGNYVVKAKLFKGVEASFEVKVTIDEKQAAEMKAEQAKAAKRKAAKAEAAEANSDAAQEDAPQTEEQKLNAEADKLIRG